MGKKDMVNHPEHYCSGGIETIDYMKAKLTPEEFRGYLKGSIIKYSSRLDKKFNTLEDAKKLRWYLDKFIEEVV